MLLTGKRRQCLEVFGRDFVSAVEITLAVASRHQGFIVVQQQLQNADSAFFADAENIDTGQRVRQWRQVIHVTVTATFEVFGLQAHDIARRGKIAAHGHLALIDILQKVSGKFVADIAQLQVCSEHRLMRLQAALAKGFKRRPILAVGTHHQVDTRFVGSPPPLCLLKVGEHLLLQHPRTVLDHLRQLKSLADLVTARLQRIHSGAVEDHPVHFKGQQRITVVPEVEAVTLRLQHLAPDVHVVALIGPDFTAAHPDKVHDFRHGPGHAMEHGVCVLQPGDRLDQIRSDLADGFGNGLSPALEQRLQGLLKQLDQQQSLRVISGLSGQFIVRQQRLVFSAAGKLAQRPLQLREVFDGKDFVRLVGFHRGTSSITASFATKLLNWSTTLKPEQTQTMSSETANNTRGLCLNHVAMNCLFSYLRTNAQGRQSRRLAALCSSGMIQSEALTGYHVSRSCLQLRLTLNTTFSRPGFFTVPARGVNPDAAVTAREGAGSRRTNQHHGAHIHLLGG
ncbi:hypothetical protein D3C72_373730 [compost metagenome]